MNIEYSVDMIRLHSLCEPDDVKRHFDIYERNPNIKYWSSFKHDGYRHNWRITQQTFDTFFQDYNEFSFYVGYEQGMESGRGKKSLVIEYNPNKCKSPTGSLFGELYDILMTFFVMNPHLVVRSIDVACDIPVDTDKIRVDKLDKKNYKILCYNGNATTYVGEGHGRVKVYNKQAELNKDGKVVQKTPLTRYEVSLKLKLELWELSMIKKFDENFLKLPACYVLNSEGSESDDSESARTMNVHYYAFQTGYPIHKMSRQYRNKMREIFNEDGKIPIDNKNILAAIQEYLKEIIKLQDVQI